MEEWIKDRRTIGDDIFVCTRGVAFHDLIGGALIDLF
jgi:hypothetical protein